MAPDDTPPTEMLLDGRYLLGACVGQGGMATVYRAEDTTLGRTVAIKMLRTEVEHASTPERARSEMTVLASLNHASLVTLYDAQLAPGRAEYLVMEFIDGPTLSARIAQGALSPQEAATLAADLAEGLHVVHSAGIVHRDIKPSNVLLAGTTLPGSRSGAKLADFGISVLADAARVTTPGLLIGTAAYLAPEQVNGAPPAPSADIYALGLVLLETLTGARAFPKAEGLGAAIARLTESPEIPDSLGPGWTELLRRMTATDPAARPTAAEVFTAASELAHRPFAAPLPPTMPASVAALAPAEHTAATRVLGAPLSRSRASRRPRRSRRAVTLIGGVAAAALVSTALTGAWLASSGTLGPAEQTPAEIARTATPDPTITEDADLASDREAASTEPAIVPVDSSSDTGDRTPSNPRAEEVRDTTGQTAADKLAAERKKAGANAEKRAKNSSEQREKNKGKGNAGG